MTIGKTTLGDLLRQAIANDRFDDNTSVDHIDEINRKEPAIMSDKTYYKITLTILRYIEVSRYFNDATVPELRTIDLTDCTYRVDFIKLIRSITGLGLRESKNICDFYTGHGNNNATTRFEFSEDYEQLHIAFVVVGKNAPAILNDIARYALFENSRNNLRNVQTSVYNPIEFPIVG